MAIITIERWDDVLTTHFPDDIVVTVRKFRTVYVELLPYISSSKKYASLDFSLSVWDSLKVSIRPSEQLYDIWFQPDSDYYYGTIPLWTEAFSTSKSNLDDMFGPYYEESSSEVKSFKDIRIFEHSYKEFKEVIGTAPSDTWSAVLSEGNASETKSNGEITITSLRELNNVSLRLIHDHQDNNVLRSISNSYDFDFSVKGRFIEVP